MPDIGTLRAVVTADSSQFNSGIREAEGTVSRLGNTLRGLAAGVGFGALLSGFNSLARINNELRVGAGIANISTQDYQALARTFEGFGVHGDAVADVINDISERLEDARGGTENYANAFRSLGIDLEDFASLDRTSRFFAFSRALQRVDADVAQLGANVLAGEQGQRLLAVIRELGDELPAIYQGFRELSFTDEQIDSIRQASDALVRLQASAQLAGAATINAIEGFAQSVGQNIGDFLAGFRGSFTSGDEQRAIQQLEAVRDEWERVREEAGAAATGMQAFQDSITVSASATSNWRQHILDLDDALGTLDTTLQQTTMALRVAIDTGEEPIRGQRVSEAAAQTAANQADALLSSLERIEDLPQPAEEAADRMAASVQQSLLLGSTINTVLGAAIGRTEDWGDVLLSVLQQIINFGIGNLSQGLGFFGGFRQFGGPVSPGQAYIVGERGPELFVPSSSGRVEPNDVIAANNFDVTFNISGAGNTNEVAQQVVQAIERLMRRPQSSVNISARTARHG